MIKTATKPRIYAKKLRNSITSHLSKAHWKKMTTPQVPALKGSASPDSLDGEEKAEVITPELLTRPQLLSRFNLKMSSFNRMRKLPGFPERILPGTSRGYRYDPREVKAWLDREEAIRKKLAL